MDNDVDVMNVAALLIKEHGADAWLEAASKHRELEEAGDRAGAAVWRRIANAISKLDDAESEGPAS
jgi:hypothetical protein